MDRDLIPIFLFSTARSGSTLAQRILAAHPAISTASEPHILLPLLFSLKTSGDHKEKDIYSLYNQTALNNAIRQFCESLPGKERDYLDEVRRFTLRLYRKAADETATHFVDKTPQYHFFAGEIIDLFPEGKHIFLWRNPLSIVASFLNFGGGLWNLYFMERYLYRGITDLLKAYRAHEDRAYHLRYEDFITSPEATWEKVFRYLDLEFDPTQLSGFSDVAMPGKIGDMNRFREGYQELRSEPLEKWKAVLGNPLRKAWTRKYLHWLGKDNLTTMGYDLDELLGEVDALPASGRFLRSDLIRMPYGYLYRIFEFRILRNKFEALRAGERVYVHTGFAK